MSEVAGASWVAAVSRLTGLGLRHTQVTPEQVSLLCTALALPSSHLSTLGRDTNQALISDKYFHKFIFVQYLICKPSHQWSRGSVLSMLVRSSSAKHSVTLRASRSSTHSDTVLLILR